MRTQASRPAFTLVELLVVIAIIGVLVAILLPAVQAAREAARRMDCQNHLRQLGLASAMYEQTHQVFSNACMTGPSHGWGTFLLPFVEQRALHDTYLFARAWDDPANFPAINSRVGVFVCPSAPSRTGTIPGGICDYVPCYNVDPTALQLGTITPRANPDGILFCNARLTMADITDGTANTLLLVEDAGRPVHHQRGRIVGQTEFAGWAASNSVTPINLDGFSADGSKMWGPCAINCTNLHEIYSFHPGGANIIFVDGHVQFVSQTIPVDRVADFVTRANGEIISEP